MKQKDIEILAMYGALILRKGKIEDLVRKKFSDEELEKFVREG